MQVCFPQAADNLILFGKVDFGCKANNRKISTKSSVFFQGPILCFVGPSWIVEVTGITNGFEYSLPKLHAITPNDPSLFRACMPEVESMECNGIYWLEGVGFTQNSECGFTVLNFVGEAVSTLYALIKGS